MAHPIRTFGCLAFLTSVTALIIACGSDRSAMFDQDVDQGGGATSGGPAGDGTSSSGFGSSSGAATSGGEGDGNCAASIAETTKPKVDIIFLIDNSPSMTGEMAQVQANINTFVQKIGGSGLDYNVVFIVKRSGSGNRICVPEPLAGPGCADKAPSFHHVDQDVQSSNSLSLALSTYDSANAALAWNKYLRMDAFKVFVEVSDDGQSDQAHMTFDGALIGKGKGQFGTAAKRNYMFHAICGWAEGTPVTDTGKCSTADAAGLEYRRLATLTGGIIDSVCKTDYSGVLNNIGKGIVDRLACELGYPTAQAADPTKVQVRLTPPAGAAQTLVQVTDASKCDANPTGWYYDDPAKPTKIVLCKSICDTANGTQGSKIEALVGCKGSGPK